MGEFRGDDAGSPVFAKVHIDTTRLDAVPARRAAAVEGSTDDVPLEATVEQRPMSPVLAAAEHRDGAGRAGWRWAASGSSWSPPSSLGACARSTSTPTRSPSPTPTDAGRRRLRAHPTVWQSCRALAGRAMDGAELYDYLARRRRPPRLRRRSRRSAGSTGRRRHRSRPVRTWFDDAVLPARAPARRLDPRAARVPVRGLGAATGGAEKVLRADEYYQGHLDWYSLDVDPDARRARRRAGPPPPEPGADADELVPAHAACTFNGMPNTRWWRFEDGRPTSATSGPTPPTSTSCC